MTKSVSAASCFIPASKDLDHAGYNSFRTSEMVAVNRAL